MNLEWSPVSGDSSLAPLRHARTSSWIHTSSTARRILSNHAPGLTEHMMVFGTNARSNLPSISRERSILGYVLEITWAPGNSPRMRDSCPPSGFTSRMFLTPVQLEAHAGK